MTRNQKIVAVALGLMLAATLIDGAAAAAVRTHLVQPGENLYRIALRYGVTVDALARANGIADPTRIRVGQVLRIPGTGNREPGTGKDSLPHPSPLPQRERETRYIVQRGDTLYSIARRHGVSVQALVASNGLASELIHPGQSLLIPVTRSGKPETGNGKREVGGGNQARTATATPPSTLLPLPLVGSEILAPKPLRVRRGPKSYETTLALVAAQTPLRIRNEENNWYEVELPDGQSGWVYQDELRMVERPPLVDPRLVRGADIVRDAMRYLGTPYVWGGESGSGVDCSGFVYIVLAAQVPGLARTSSFEYFRMGTAIDRANLLPGDLVFFTTYAAGPSHVGIYIGEGKFIQASSGARRVVITPLDDPYYAARYLGARRLLNP